MNLIAFCRGITYIIILALPFPFVALFVHLQLHRVCVGSAAIIEKSMMELFLRSVNRD